MPTGEPWWNQIVQEFAPELRRQNHPTPRPISLLTPQSREEGRARGNQEYINRPGVNRQRFFPERSRGQIRDQPDSNNNSNNNFYNDNCNTNHNSNAAHLLNMSHQYHTPYYQRGHGNEHQVDNQRMERQRYTVYNRNSFRYRTTTSRHTAAVNRNDTTNNNNSRYRSNFSRTSSRRSTSQEPRDNANLQIQLSDRPAPSNDAQAQPVRDAAQDIEIAAVSAELAACNTESGTGDESTNTSGNIPEARLHTSQEDMCFLCEEIMQNSEQLGIHFCIGRDDVRIPVSGDQVSGNSSDSMDIEQDSDSSVEGSQLNKSVSIIATSSPCSSNDNDVSTICIGSKGSEKAANGKGKCNRLTLIRLHQVIQNRLGQLQQAGQEAQQEKQKLVLLKKSLDEKTADFQRKEELLKKVEEKLLLAQQDMTKKQQKDREELSRKWQELKDETKRMEDVHESQKGRIRIDVGGRIFTTSISTLTCDQSSMLAAMFSGRHVVHKEEDGTVFIDRDGTHFRHILNYLRDGALSLDTIPRNRQILKELRNEAAFYQLNGLLQLIEAYL